MTSTNYGFTIKCIKSGYKANEGELIAVMYDMAIFHKGHVTQYFIEADSIERLHVHGIMTARKGLLLSRFKKQFWHIHLDHLKSDIDLKNWESYIKKDEIDFKGWLSELRSGKNMFQNPINIIECNPLEDLL